MASNIDETLILSSGTATGSFQPIDYSERYVFLCYKKPQVWPPHIEAAEFDRLPRLLSAAIASRKVDMKKQTRLTVCEGHDGTESSNGDVLIFPDMIRYRKLTHFDVDTFVEQVLVKEGEWLPGNPESLTGTFIFVCAHGSRDQRCGVCGPAVIARLRTEIGSRGLQTKVSVRPCSHIGGHKYARNVIIFGSTNHGKVTGHWYGYVMPDDVPALLEHHVEKGEFVDRLWRGQKGLSEDNQNNNIVTNMDDDCDCEPVEHGGCCKTNGCFNTTPEHATNYKCATKVTTSRKSNMPTWVETWEREDVYATLALIGAALSVAVAYNCYRQLG